MLDLLGSAVCHVANRPRVPVVLDARTRTECDRADETHAGTFALREGSAAMGEVKPRRVKRPPRPVTFETFVDSSNPHHCGSVTVELTPTTVKVSGPDGAEFNGTWAELCDLLTGMKHLERAQEWAEDEGNAAKELTAYLRRVLTVADGRVAMLQPPCSKCGERQPPIRR